ncbi:hypothetical protein [Myxococcus sp. AB036A]|uniref:hypothetical protein n=1 Tax=Myxococcus sp. AB036A TaxID=2562793 RepID=UPI0011478AA2|nr:hypothetical protein [Myxococcus sp. AB036A]
MALFAASAPTSAFAAHLKTIDGKWFDFMPSGVYSLLKSGRLQVQASQSPSAPPGVGSIKAVAIAYGKSLVRFFLQGDKLVVARGSSNASSLVVFRSGVNPNSYRVFSPHDPASYFDIDMGSSQFGNYLNVAAVASPFLRRQGIEGVLGNGNGNPLDDVVDNQELNRRFRLPESNNLFACASGDCQLVPLSSADKLMNMSIKAPQGYSKVDVAKLSVRAFVSNE